MRAPGVSRGPRANARTVVNQAAHTMHALRHARRMLSSSPENPRAAVKEAMDLLSAFSERLKRMQSVTREGVFKEVVMSCRDADAETYHNPAMRDARENLKPAILELEREMIDMAKLYEETLAPKMAEVSQLCQSTPCGGLSWQFMDGGTPLTTSRVDGGDTPCGKFAAASADFLGLTLETRADSELASRAAVFLRMAATHDNPLAIVNESVAGKRALAETFAREKIATPWIRSKEEYARYQEIRSREGR